jgi:hypothetical protein
MAKRARHRRRADPLFWWVVTVLAAESSVLGFQGGYYLGGVLGYGAPARRPEFALFATLMDSTIVPHILVGGVSALAVYLWRVTEGNPFHLSTALLRTATGLVFGFLGGRAAEGLGANKALQTFAAGIAAGAGPQVVIDMAVDRIRPK